MNGCIYRTEYMECSIPNRSEEYGPMCRSDCTDKHPSNADRIRAMSDEELVKFAMNNQCPPGNYFDQNLCTNAALTGKCEKCWLDWLKQEKEGE